MNTILLMASIVIVILILHVLIKKTYRHGFKNGVESTGVHKKEVVDSFIQDEYWKEVITIAQSESNIIEVIGELKSKFKIKPQ